MLSVEVVEGSTIPINHENGKESADKNQKISSDLTQTEGSVGAAGSPKPECVLRRSSTGRPLLAGKYSKNLQQIPPHQAQRHRADRNGCCAPNCSGQNL
ncbi:hypothetical protein L596_005026 [Steinernema carpocapsae]|uniref:Uncharacterized protein n=1 Tax=Steinernema carpocapsae TaxID=34508 RepID=A0A4U8UXS6_STECR|nr:hypothetical protein L596_005026 [Steinernema carpocapsae]